MGLVLLDVFFGNVAQNAGQVSAFLQQSAAPHPVLDFARRPRYPKGETSGPPADPRPMSDSSPSPRSSQDFSAAIAPAADWAAAPDTDWARALSLPGLQAVCIGNGILTVEHKAQADTRAGAAGQNKGGGAAAAALHLIALSRKWAGQTKGIGFRA